MKRLTSIEPFLLRVYFDDLDDNIVIMLHFRILWSKWNRILRGTKSCIFTTYLLNILHQHLRSKFLIEFSTSAAMLSLSRFHGHTRERMKREQTKRDWEKSPSVSKRFIRNRKSMWFQTVCFFLCWRVWVSPHLCLFFPLISFFYFVPITSNSSPWTHNKINSLCCKPLSLWK